MNILRVLKKFKSVLSQHQKIRILELAILMIIGGFMEMMSVSLMLPFMEAVMNPNKIMKNTYVQMVCDAFNIHSSRTFLVFLALVMAAIYILKNVFLLFQLNVQNRFVYNNMFSTQQKLLHNYLLRPYDFFLNVKSGEVLRVIGSDTTNAFTLLTTLLQLLSEFVVSVALVGTIFVMAPEATLGIAILLLALVFIIMRVIRPMLRKSGIRNQNASIGMNQWMIQSIQGIKDVKIMQRESFFENNFSKNGYVYVKTLYQNQTFSVIPRFLIEAVSMSAFFVVIAAMIFNGTELDAIIPLLSGVAMAAIRLLPSINRISQGMANISFGEAALDKMIENLREVEEYNNQSKNTDTNADTKIVFNQQVELLDINYRYPTGKNDVLSDASLVIHKGESVGIVGASGSGKTTAVDVFLGLLRPQNGKVLVDGTDIQFDMDGWLKQIGYIPQTIFMLDGDIRENVVFGLPKEDIDDKRVWEVLKEAAIDDFVRTLPDGLDTQLGERGVRLSGGQRQRIGIARALYSDPEVLFFDEATSALDNDTEAAIMDSINHLQGSKTMIIIAHRLSTIEGCDHIYRVENGRIVKER